MFIRCVLCRCFCRWNMQKKKKKRWRRIKRGCFGLLMLLSSFLSTLLLGEIKSLETVVLKTPSNQKFVIEGFWGQYTAMSASTHLINGWMKPSRVAEKNIWGIEVEVVEVNRFFMWLWNGDFARLSFGLIHLKWWETGFWFSLQWIHWII